MAGLYIRLKGVTVNGLPVRDALGRFQNQSAKLRDQRVAENRRLAEQVQVRAVEILEESIVRPSVSTQRLAKVTADAKNIFVSADGNTWGVGVEDYLDGSVARYWRMIEEGSDRIYGGGTGMFGREIFWNPFRGRAQNAWGGSVDDGGRHAGGPWGVSNGKVDAITYSKGRQLEGRFRWYHPIIIGREIAPHRYYAQAFAELDIPTRELRVITGEMQKLFNFGL